MMEVHGKGKDCVVGVGLGAELECLHRCCNGLKLSTLEISK